MNKYQFEIHLKTGDVLIEKIQSESMKKAYNSILELYLHEDQEDLLIDGYPMMIIPKRNINYIKLKHAE